MRLAIAMVALGASLLTGCTSDSDDGPACRVNLSIRQPDASPLDDADTLRVFVFDEGRTVYSTELPLTSTDAGAVIDVISDETTPVLEFSTTFEVVLAAYRSGQTSVGAFGRSAPFECVGEDSIDVPVYLGPAMGFATSAGNPEGRRAATATALGDSRVFIYGGRTIAGSPVTPVADLYDHTSGSACAVAGGCPTGANDPSVGHSATRLSDGRVLIVGGSIPIAGAQPVQLAARSLVERFDPSTGNVELLTDTLAVSLHAAVHLDSAEVPAAKRGQVLIIGGLNGPSSASADIGLVDPSTGAHRVIGTLPSPRYALTATLVSGGRVLIAGGSIASGAPTATVALFDVDAETLVTPAVDAPCPSPGGAADALCAQRSQHTATPLDNGNVLLWGGVLNPVAGGEDPPPEAEVYVAAERRFVPVRLPVATGDLRVGHTTTPIDCFRPPCPILVAGGRDPNVASVTQPPYLFESPSGVEVTAGVFNATVTPFVTPDATTLRAFHSAAALPDGTVLLTGGTRADADQLVLEGAVFSLCEDVASVGGVGCPSP